jgi:hypothetical protein
MKFFNIQNSDEVDTNLSSNLTTSIFAKEFNFGFSNYIGKLNNYDNISVMLDSDAKYENPSVSMICNTSKELVTCLFPNISLNHIRIKISFNVTFHSLYFNSSVSIKSKEFLFTGKEFPF